MTSLWQYLALGAVGGTLSEVLAVLKWITAWQGARREETGQLKGTLPTFQSYVDVPAHAWLLAIRVPLGAGTALLLGATGQVEGPIAALAFGFAAPAVLAQLGSIPAVSDQLDQVKSVDAPQVGVVPSQTRTAARDETA